MKSVARIACHLVSAAVTFAVLACTVRDAAAQATCAHFTEVKAAIDNVIDKDERLGADFRRKFKDGEDSIYILEGLLAADLVKKMDICRYDVAEYLTRRGFPPPH